MDVGPSSRSSTSQGGGVNSSEDLAQPPEDKKKRLACQGCFGIKVRCVEVPPSGGSTQLRCARCIRLNIPCVPREASARRGRPREKSLAPPVASDMSLDLGPALRGSTKTPPTILPTWEQSTTEVSPQHAHAAFILSLPSVLTGDIGAPSHRLAQSPFSDNHSSHTTASAPRQAVVLSLNETSEAKSASARKSVLLPRPSPQPVYPDPVDMRILGRLEAEHLFNLFHENLNPFVDCFDPKLHTATYVQATSTVLFASILAVSAKFYRPDLYSSLLSHAQQLVARGLADSLSHIGMVQALMVLIYWKESHDRSAWLRVGWAVRLAGQLKLFAPRTGSLPSDPIEARELMSAERTWFCLICFDGSYRLHDEYPGSSDTALRDHVGMENWINQNAELRSYNDLQIWASLELLDVHRILHTLEETPWTPSSDGLVAFVRGLLEVHHRKHLLPGSLTYEACLGTPSEHKILFFHHWATVLFSKACLTSKGMQDTTLLAEFIPRAVAFVQCFEDMAARPTVLERLQDTAAITLFSFAEFLAKLFPNVGTATQTLIVNWMARVYNSCHIEATGKDEGVPAYIQRFYRVVLRHLAYSNSIPPTRAPSPGVNITAEDGAPLSTNPFDHLGPLEQDLFPDLATGIELDQVVDLDYWGSVFPGSTDDNWAWLQPPYFASNDGTSS